jgi:methyltransferase (TIGR00027 family)
VALSRTSILVAAARAFGSREPDPSVRNPDYLAARILSQSEIDLIREHPVGQAYDQDYQQGIRDPAILPVVWMMLVRTRFIDEKLKAAVANGIRQVVVLGAGFDTRAYRFSELLHQSRFVESDAPETQLYKKRRLAATIGELPRNVKYCTLDLRKDDLEQVLTGAGLSKSERTIFILEGVCMYLPEEIAVKTFRNVAGFGARGSILIADYANSRGIEAIRSRTNLPSGFVANWGEPWLFGVPGEDGAEFFRNLGFEPLAVASINDHGLRARYAMSSDGTVYGAEVFQRMREEAEKLRPSGDGNEKTQMRDIYWLAELAVV